MTVVTLFVITSILMLYNFTFGYLAKSIIFLQTIYQSWTWSSMLHVWLQVVIHHYTAEISTHKISIIHHYIADISTHNISMIHHYTAEISTHKISMIHHYTAEISTHTFWVGYDIHDPPLYCRDINTYLLGRL